MGQPAENVRVAAQLIERTNRRMIGAEIDQEVARYATVTVLTGRIRSLGGSERLDGSPEPESQWMLKGSVAGEPHEQPGGVQPPL